MSGSEDMTAWIFGAAKSIERVDSFLLLFIFSKVETLCLCKNYHLTTLPKGSLFVAKKHKDSTKFFS